MSMNSIPVELTNPGQVFACLGFLEASDLLCSDAKGGFDWNEGDETSFFIEVSGKKNPFESVLEFLAEANAKAVLPKKWRPNKDPQEVRQNETQKQRQKRLRELEKLEGWLEEQHISDQFPEGWPNTHTAMPVRISGTSGKSCILRHWADGSSRDRFKLYAGNRSALDITIAMLGHHDNASKGRSSKLQTKGLAQLWKERKADLIARPFHVTPPMGGSFNFDPRGAWTAIDAGYSPDTHSHKVVASPVVEILAAWGLENFRPNCDGRQASYAAWASILPPILARVALSGDLASVPQRRFIFDLGISGKNKVVTFSEETGRRGLDLMASFARPRHF